MVAFRREREIGNRSIRDRLPRREGHASFRGFQSGRGDIVSMSRDRTSANLKPALPAEGSMARYKGLFEAKTQHVTHD